MNLDRIYKIYKMKLLTTITVVRPILVPSLNHLNPVNPVQFSSSSAPERIFDRRVRWDDPLQSARSQTGYKGESRALKR